MWIHHSQDRGIGSRVIDATIAKAFDNVLIDQVLLSVVRSNGHAIKLYEKFGFVQYGIIEYYFKGAHHSSSQLFMALTRQSYITSMFFKENTR